MVFIFVACGTGPNENFVFQQLVFSQYSDQAMGWTSSRFFSLPLHPDWLWIPPMFLSWLVGMKWQEHKADDSSI
jgi:hypothetical protein